MWGWIVATGLSLVLFWKFSKIFISLYATLPGIILEDAIHKPQFPFVPIVHANGQRVFLWVLGSIAWAAFLILWMLWLAGRSIFPWVFLAEIAFFLLALPGGTLPSDYLVKLRRLCTNQAEQNAWLAFFEKQSPELAALPPLWLHPKSVPWQKTVWTMSALAVSFSPLLYKIIQQGYFVLAITGICTLLLAIITGTPLIRWTGYLVGGRYAAWVAYHFLLES